MKFSPQGNLYLAKRDTNGLPSTFFSLGCLDDLSLAFTLDKWEHLESCSGQYAVDAEGIKGKKCAGSGTVSDFNSKNLVLLLNGTDHARAGTTSAVTNEAMPAGIVNGDIYFAGQSTGDPKSNLSAVTVHDSTGSPQTLVLNTDYTLDTVSGKITIINVGSYVQPFTVSYTHQQDEYVSMLTGSTDEFWFRFLAKNMQNSGKVSWVDLYRCRPDPTSKLDLLAQELSLFPLTFSVLIDQNKTDSGALGQFGRISLPQ